MTVGINNTVGDLKKLLAQSHGLPFEQIQLSVNTDLMKDNSKILKDIGITNSSQLQCVLKPKLQAHYAEEKKIVELFEEANDVEGDSEEDDDDEGEEDCDEEFVEVLVDRNKKALDFSTLPEDDKELAERMSKLINGVTFPGCEGTGPALVMVVSGACENYSGKVAVLKALGIQKIMWPHVRVEKYNAVSKPSEDKQTIAFWRWGEEGVDGTDSMGWSEETQANVREATTIFAEETTKHFTMQFSEDHCMNAYDFCCGFTRNGNIIAVINERACT